MNKNYFNLIGFIIVMLINYFIKNYSNQDYSENPNQINFFEIIENGLRPIGFFLLTNFFYKKEIKLQFFMIFILVIMITESLFQYFNGKDFFDYNYTIGMVSGLVLLFFIGLIERKFINKPQSKYN